MYSSPLTFRSGNKWGAVRVLGLDDASRWI